MRYFVTLSQFISRTFCLWMLLFVAWAYLSPQTFKPLAPWVSSMLGVVMFGMGLTLSIQDFKGVLTHPKEVFLGVFAQFSLMPVIAYGLCVLFNLPKELALGVILVGSCPGGTSSNVLTFIARGDVALSITLTSVTTVLSPLITPFIIGMLAQEWITINTGAMCWSIVQIVLLPVAAGVLIHSIFREKISKISSVTPLLSIITIILIIAVVVASSQKSLAAAALTMFAVVVLHNGLGLLLGYLLSYACGFSHARNTAIAIEVGTQNAGLGATLATIHFAFMPQVAIASAIFSFWNILAGAFVAGILKKFHK